MIVHRPVVVVVVAVVVAAEHSGGRPQNYFSRRKILKNDVCTTRVYLCVNIQRPMYMFAIPVVC